MDDEKAAREEFAKRGEGWARAYVINNPKPAGMTIWLREILYEIDARRAEDRPTGCNAIRSLGVLGCYCLMRPRP